MLPQQSHEQWVLGAKQVRTNGTQVTMKFLNVTHSSP